MRARLSLLGAVTLVLALGPAPATAEPVRVALLPIAVHSAEPDAAYVSSGLAAMLSARLERSGQVSVVRVDTESAVRDEPEALAAARDSGAGFVVYGSFTQFGQGASFDVRCAQVGAPVGGARQIFIHSGSIGEIIPRLDDLAEKLTRYVEGGAVSPVAPAANGAPGVAAGELQELQRRVEELERAVYRGAEGAAAPGEGALGLPVGDGPEGGDESLR